jgi:hypothetical protein
MPVSVSEHNQDHAETLLTHLLEDVPAALLEQYKASQTELPPPGILPGSDPLEEVQQ